MESLLTKYPRPQKSRIHIFRQVFLSLSCFLQGICNGAVLGMSSILLPQLQGSMEIPLDKDQESWITSIPTLMLIPTVLWTGSILDYFGRRKSLAYVFVLTAIAWIVTYSANCFTTLLIGRALCGTFIGQAYPIVLTYLGEIADPSIRAVCIAGAPLGCAVGVLVIQLLGIYLHWKTVSLIIFAIPIYNLCAMLYIRESYIWHINRGCEDEARKVFLWYRGQCSSAESEFSAALENSNENSDLSLREKVTLIFSKKFANPFGLTCLLFLTSEFSGDIAIIFYTSQIVKIVTNNVNIRYYATLLLNILRVMTTCCSCVLLKKWSPRNLWIRSGYCLALCLLNISLFLHLTLAFPENKAYPIVCVTSIIVNVVFYALGAGPLPSVICGELYPAKLRGVGNAISTFICFASIFTIVKIMPSFFAYVNPPLIFLCFAICTFTGVTVSCCVLPDTKNRTLKDLETFYERQ